MSDKKNEEVKFVTPPNKIRKKVGYGGLPEETFSKADMIFEEMANDYPSIVRNDLKTIAETASHLSKTGILTEQERTAIQNAAIHLKSSGSMFHYPIITEMANNLLNFIERVPEIKKEVIEIIIAYHKSMSLIIASKKTGDTGDYGKILMTELQSVTARYFKDKKS